MASRTGTSSLGEFDPCPYMDCTVTGAHTNCLTAGSFERNPEDRFRVEVDVLVIGGSWDGRVVKTWDTTGGVSTAHEHYVRGDVVLPEEVGATFLVFTVEPLPLLDTAVVEERVRESYTSGALTPVPS
jgi:hypothetical protein